MNPNKSKKYDLGELHNKLNQIGISFNEDNQVLFNGKTTPHVICHPIQNETSSDSVLSFFIYYENNEKKFILAQKEIFDSNPSLKTRYEGQNIKFIEHETDLHPYDYCYQVLSQIQDGKDVENLECCSDETASVESDSILKTVSIDSLSSYKTAIDQDEITSANSQFSFFGMKRDTCINVALFTLSAACMVAFGFTMAGPAFLVGLFLFAALLNRIISSNLDKTSSLSV